MYQPIVIFLFVALSLSCNEAKEDSSGNGVQPGTRPTDESTEVSNKIQSGPRDLQLEDKETTSETSHGLEDTPLVLAPASETPDNRKESTKVEEQVSVNVPREVVSDSLVPDQTLPDAAMNIHQHQAWDELLAKYVSKEGQVNYLGISKNRKLLDQYLKLLSDNPVQPSWSRQQQLAYWTNAYNAFTIEMVLRHYPVRSIRDIKDPWDQVFITLGDQNYSLNQIEHRIVRPQFKDARIHFAFVCAAVSCPKLLDRAYVPPQIDQQFDAATRHFLNQSGKNQLGHNSIKISQLFNWYAEDFEREGGVIDFLNRYADKKISPNATIEFLEYDWSLNE